MNKRGQNSVSTQTRNSCAFVWPLTFFRPVTFVKPVKRLILFIALLACSNGFVYASTAGDISAAEAWFNDDSEQLIEDVNEGDLNFIAPITGKKILHSESKLTITDASLEAGWVDLQQCYRNLDPIGETDVVYRYKNIKRLKITSLSNIGEARVNGQTIHLQDVGASAHLCIQAEVQILEQVNDQNFSLTSGPYHLKFLDGYYPYHVTLTIRYPANRLNVTQVLPAPQALFKVIKQPGRLFLDTWFEGVLLIEVKLQAKRQ